MFKTKLKLLSLTAILTLFAFNAFAQDDAEKLGKEIFEKYQTAVGGKENLDKIKTIETISEVEMMGTKKKQTTIEDKVNKKSYSISEGGIEGKQENGFDGTRSWVKNMSFRGYRDSLRVSADTGKMLKMPNETIDGTEYLVIQSVSNNFTIKSFYDPTTYFLARREAKGNVSGMSILQTTVYTDYRKVGEIFIAFSEVLTNGQFTITKKVLSVRQNIEFNPKIFEFSDNDEKKPNETPSKSGDESKQTMKVATDSNTIYKDENGKVISPVEFMQKKNSSNYSIEPEIVNGKLAGLKLKKGGAETEIGATALDFSGTLLDGSTVQLSQLKGKVIVLNFWFAGCAPCIQEMPELNNLVKKYQGKEVEFLSITYDPKADVSEFLKKRKFDYKIVTDAQNVVDLYKVTSFPTHIVLDRQGKILFSQFGLQTGIIENLIKNIDNGLRTNSKVEWDNKNPNVIVPESIKKETFDKVWTTINDTYFDQTFNGVDWKAVKTKYEPQLAEANTNQNLNDLLNRMIGELKASHLKIIPSNQIAVNGVVPVGVPKMGSIGVDLRLLNKSELAVTAVREKSPAEAAGIKKGYLIKKVNGETIAEIVQKQRDKGGFQPRDEIVAVRAVAGKISGDLDKKVSVTYLDENNAEKTLELDRQSPGARSLTFEAKELSQDVGYIKFDIFLGDLPQKFAEAVATMQNKKALIVDLRGNPGGVGNHTTAIAALLDKEKRSLGVSQYRYSKQQFDYEGNNKSFKGKVFILIDELSGSSSEVLAGGLQANKRAIVIGQNSAGAVLPSTMEILPNGGALQYAVADFKTPDGKLLEGKGVTPDVEVKLTRKDLLAGRDLALEMALKLVISL